ncbi:HAD-IIIA family hydrolase [Tautonia plasticadhaerens]|uniref:D-glycero-alpha-D-manno-heptose-1,7-bisphosphate 7-phosphatase n=1 Tax=Tautonia plasticadhaerens TaxID=2527974 RepID=A0A518HFK8_9BACT|nr:HAD-IIIA family hydrolase [Tautonia plasticadhaerens]QDV39611.1 D-glycero-alpha-D-manno-heptose-1,7-bisphosphate 7-phosphatase [Tautonia plasticadhaerens]
MGKTNALLLAGGLGTRLRPVTDSIPKCLVPIAGRPLLDHWVDRLAPARISEARVNIHAHADQVRSFIRRVDESGRLRMTEAFEPILLGSAGTVAANVDLADGVDEVLIVYADNFSTVDLAALLDFHRSHPDPATMLLFRAPDPRACGVAELADESRVISFAEKPELPRGDLANAGVYVLDAGLYREVASMRAFDLGFDVLPGLVGRMRGRPWHGYHRDVGTHEALRLARRDAPAVLLGRRPPITSRPAVFLDRDGTVIEHVHYLRDPAEVRLLPGAAGALRRLAEAGFACVLATNQSAVGRGMMTPDDLDRVHEELARQLWGEGIMLAAVESCPAVPVGPDRTVVEQFDRKPGPGMLVRAAGRLGLDLNESWMIGDAISDVLAGVNAGCRGSILVRTGLGVAPGEAGLPISFDVADDLAAAADRILDDPAGARRAAG